VVFIAGRGVSRVDRRIHHRLRAIGRFLYGSVGTGDLLTLSIDLCAALARRGWQRVLPVSGRHRQGGKGHQ